VFPNGLALYRRRAPCLNSPRTIKAGALPNYIQLVPTHGCPLAQRRGAASVEIPALEPIPASTVSVAARLSVTGARGGAVGVPAPSVLGRAAYDRRRFVDSRKRRFGNWRNVSPAPVQARAVEAALAADRRLLPIASPHAAPRRGHSISLYRRRHMGEAAAKPGEAVSW